MSSVSPIREDINTNLPTRELKTSLLNSPYRTSNLTIQQMISFVFLFLILFLGWILNCTVIVGLRKDRRLAHITYFYVISLCVAMLLLAALNFPPAVIYDTFGNKPQMDMVCIAWIYMDTFLCNVVFLHVFGASLDSYLRLRNPCRYVHSTQRGSTWLKLAAPWGVSFCQTTTQFAITGRYTGLFKEGVCLLEDPNFLILRSAMSYGLPMLASLILIILGVKQLRDQRFLSQEALVDLVKSYHGSSGFDEQTQCLWSDTDVDRNEDDTIEDNANETEIGYNRFSIYEKKSNSKIRSKKRRIPASSSCGQISTITRDLTTDTFITQSSSSDHLRMPPIPELVEHICPKHGRLAYPQSGGQGVQAENHLTMSGANENVDSSEYSPSSPNYQASYPMQILQSSLTLGEPIHLPSTSANIYSPNSHAYHAKGHCTCSRHRTGAEEITYYIPPINSNVENSLQRTGRTGSLTRFSSQPASTFSTINGGELKNSQFSLSLSPTMMSDLGNSTLPLKKNHHSNSNPVFNSPSLKDNGNNGLTTNTLDDQVVTTVSHLCSEMPPTPTAHLRSNFSSRDGTASPKRRNHIKISWCRVYKTEKTAIALNMVSCIVSIGLWSPFMLATLLHGLCKPPLCTLEVPIIRLVEFKWLAYSSVLVYALLFLIVDKRIRQAATIAVTCKK